LSLETHVVRPLGPRDLRIDLLRGLALWMIFVDHVPGNVARLFTYHQLGFSNAAEIFVFLSGVSCSLAYGRILGQQGFVAAQGRAIRRALHIYLGYFLVTAVSFVLFFNCRSLGCQDSFTTDPDFAFLISAPLSAFFATIRLAYMPGFIDILPLYMVLVVFAPVAIFGLRRCAPLVFGASAALWIAVGLVPSLNFLSQSTFNPLSWQLLFCAGLWVGERYYGRDATFRPNSYIAALCGAVIVANLIARGIYNAERVGALHLANDWLAATMGGARQASNEHILRLSHFLAVAYITAGYALRPDAQLLRSPLAKPLIWCGQQSLYVFCLGALLSQVMTMYIENFHAGIANQLAMNLLCVVLMTLLALSLCAWNGRAFRARHNTGARLLNHEPYTPSAGD
jgi:hypothetical protein